jgi:general stress protein 26
MVRTTPLLLAALLVSTSAFAQGRTTSMDAAAAGRFARLALSCVHREYPNKIAHVLTDDGDVQPPRALSPAFYGCYDWHSSVHGHWLLARLARLYPAIPFAAEARAALARSLTRENLAAEVAYLRGAGRVSFERPYGLAWLLLLAAELRAWDGPQAAAWIRDLEPLEAESAQRLAAWLPKLRYPIRVGEHSQTAFAFGLIRDWASVKGDTAMLHLIDDRARDYYLRDRACPIAYEPSGEDFLSPCLAEADLMRRVLAPAEFAKWLSEFLPAIPSGGGGEWLAPGQVTDRSDPKLAHIDGLNLSRAWMLEGIASRLPAGDPRSAPITAAATAHARAALPAVTGEHYEGGHWLGTFAVYLTSQAGIPSRPARSGASPVPQPVAPAALDRAKIIDAARDIIRTVRYATLSTSGEDGHPQARVMDPFDPDPAFAIRFATNAASRKVGQLRRDSRVTLLYSDPSSQAYVVVLGKAEPVTDPAERSRWWKEEWASFYKDRSRGADYLLFAVRPTRLEIVSEKHGLPNDPATWRPVAIDLPW